MELKVHDLIQIDSSDDIFSYTKEPNWLERSIKKAPFVVVRRAYSESDFVPVGIRGKNRNERFAAFLNVNNIKTYYTPEQIVKNENWLLYSQKIFSYIEYIKQVMNKNNLIWGLVGSVGFELISNVPMVNKNSDIDLIIRYTPCLTPSLSRFIINYLDKLPIQVDIQVETNFGSFALQEYAYANGKPILFKTRSGPILKHIKYGAVN